MEVQGTNSILSTTNPQPHINHLPVELLQQIFLLVQVRDFNAPDDHPSIFSPEYDIMCAISPTFTAPPLLFTRVCHLWRVVACSTTRLWSCIQIMLPGAIKPLPPFLPPLLKFWLACSGDHPLTLRIGSRPLVKPGQFQRLLYPKANSRIFGILLSEKGRWETVTFVSTVREWQVKLDTLDTPQLRTLECDISDLKRFNAPNLSCLHVRGFIYASLAAILYAPTPTTTNIRHLHLDYASIRAICSTAVIFPHLKTFRVNRIFPCSEHDIVTHSWLNIESMTLPISDHNSIRSKLIAIFKGLHPPTLQKLILVSEPGETQVAHVKEALEAASCFPRVIDFETTTPLSAVDADIVESLLKFVEEVTVCGEMICCRASCTIKTPFQWV